MRQDDDDSIALCLAGLFSGGSGEEALAWMRRITIDRELRPDATEAELRDLEGQRRFVRRLCNMIERGRHGR